MTHFLRVNGEEIGPKLTTTILHIADLAGIKKLRKKTEGKNVNRWFDKECGIEKNKLRQLANLLKKEPDKTELRIKLFVHKKRFKNLVNGKNGVQGTDHQ